MQQGNPMGTPTKTAAGPLRWTLVILAVMAAFIASVALTANLARAEGGQDQDPGMQLLPRIESVKIQGQGPYKAGDVITIKVSFTERMYVAGKSKIKIKVGENLRYATATRPESGTEKPLDALLYSYKVQAGDEDANGVSIPGVSADESSPPMAMIEFEGCASIRDADIVVGFEGSRGRFGSHLIHTFQPLGDDPNQAVDTVAPTVSGVSVSDAPGGAPYGAGDDIIVTATFSEPVNISGGNPSIVIEVGGGTRTAAFKEQTADKRAIRFAYRVQQGDADADGVSVAADSITLPENATIQDAAGNGADLSHGKVAANAKATVDAAPPAATGLSVASTGVYAIGDEIRFSLTFNKAVQVQGVPTLSFNAGTESRQASYSGTTGNTVSFAYQVKEDDSAPNGLSVNADSVSLPEGASVAGPKGLKATLDHPAVSADASQAIDGVRPTVSSLAMTGAAGVRNAGDDLQVLVTFSEAVSVAGKPAIGLTVGAASRTAAYSGTVPDDAGRTTFTYSVQRGDEDTDGVSATAGSIAMPEGASVRDLAGNDANPAHQGMAANSEYTVSAVKTVKAISISVLGEPKHYGASETLSVAVGFDEQVRVSGKPAIALQVGDTERTAAFQQVKDGKNVVFAYTVAVGDNDADGVSVKAGSISLPSGAAIVDANGRAVALGHPAMPDQAGHVVDTRRPEYDTSGASHPKGFAFFGAGTEPQVYGAGGPLDLFVHFDEPVRVEHSPTIELTVGDQTKTATYVGKGPGCPEGDYCGVLRFRYVVAAEDHDSDGVAVKPGTIRYPGRKGSIKDQAGNKARVDHGGWSHANNPRVDTAPDPELLEVTMVGPTGTREPGSNLFAFAKFNTAVRQQGSPTLALLIGDQKVSARFLTRSNSIQSPGLLFFYRIPEGLTDTDGVSVPADPITLGEGGAITSTGGTTAELAYAGTPANPDYKVVPSPR